MTPQELEIIRLKARIQALETVVATALPVVRLLPNGPEVRQCADLLRKETQNVVLKDRDAAQSDLHAAELQDAMDTLLAYVQKIVDAEPRS